MQGEISSYMTLSTAENVFVNIGLAKEDRKSTIEHLNNILADMHLIYVKTRNFHWNVRGHSFHSLHEMFEQQYNQLKLGADKVAERIRMIGGYAIGTMAEFSEHSRLTESPNRYPDSQTMVSELLEDHEIIISHLRKDIELVSEKYNDAGTEDLLIEMMQMHEEMAWMLRATYEGGTE